MAKKEFTYRGKNLAELQQLSVSQLSELFTAAPRRKIKRGFTEQEQTFLKKLLKKGTAKTHVRDMLILPSMVGKTAKLHNGKSFEQIVITEEMIGHVLGEFSHTCRPVKHGAAGVGSTKSGAAKKNTT